MGLEIGIGIK